MWNKITNNWICQLGQNCSKTFLCLDEKYFKISFKSPRVLVWRSAPSNWCPKTWRGSTTPCSSLTSAAGYNENELRFFFGCGRSVLTMSVTCVLVAAWTAEKKKWPNFVQTFDAASTLNWSSSRSPAFEIAFNALPLKGLRWLAWKKERNLLTKFTQI